ncbi:MAG: UTP--glucose-1-phosphate uridylyltransferase GalU [Pseudomonadota bacterium]
MSADVKVAVFPVAGLGTRFLPATKAVPKEMLPVVDRPVIQYAVEEAKEAGIEEFVFVTSRGKSAIEDHFDRHAELYETLERRDKHAALEEAQSPDLPAGNFTLVRQPGALGLGHAVWCARHIVGNRPFAVLLPDEVFRGRPGVLRQMVDAQARFGGNVIAVREVPPEQTDRYGIVDPTTDDGTAASVKGLVEKPDPAEAPSNLAIVGRYILQPEILSLLGDHERGAGGEIQLTDAMARMIGNQPFHALRFQGDRFDCGDKAQYVAANLVFALDRPDLADKVREKLGPYL